MCIFTAETPLQREETKRATDSTDAQENCELFQDFSHHWVVIITTSSFGRRVLVYMIPQQHRRVALELSAPGNVLQDTESGLVYKVESYDLSIRRGHAEQTHPRQTFKYIRRRQQQRRIDYK